MRLTSTEIAEQRTLAHNDDAGVQMVVPAGTTGTTTAAVVTVDTLAPVRARQRSRPLGAVLAPRGRCPGTCVAEGWQRT